MNLSDFNYNLPNKLIATEPVKPRDHSRLLVLDKVSGGIEHKHFYDIVDYLKSGDVLVLNNTKVFPARLFGKKETGGRVEIFLLQEIKENIWEALLKGKNLQVEQIIILDENNKVKVKEKREDGTVVLEFETKNFREYLKESAEIPLPPYILKQREEQDLKIKKEVDRENYQTVFSEIEGSVAAPTAGLHFTPELLKKIKDKGIEILEITLHVGLGTFAPVKVDDFASHKMHSEWYEINEKTAKALKLAKQKNKRIIPVGTTSARTLESFFQSIEVGQEKLSAWTDIFIYPPYNFLGADAMITNFHLPKSTLLMLVSAMAGRENIFKAYKEAIKEKYRFYSYGDAMLII